MLLLYKALHTLGSVLYPSRQCLMVSVTIETFHILKTSVLWAFVMSYHNTYHSWLCHSYYVQNPCIKHLSTCTLYRHYLEVFVWDWQPGLFSTLSIPVESINHPSLLFILIPYKVNIDHQTTREIIDNMRSPDRETFTKAQQSIYLLMARDSFVRFVRSEPFQAALKR